MTTNNDLKQLIDKEFVDPIITDNVLRDKIIVKFKGSNDMCEFGFVEFDKEDKYCDESFVGHNCLSFNFTSGTSGMGYMKVADIVDLSNEIVDFISTNLKLSKRKHSEQLLLFNI